MKRYGITAALARIATLSIGLVIGGGSVTVTWPANADSTAINRGVSTAVRFDVSPTLTELARRQPTVVTKRDGDKDNDRPTGLEGPRGPQDFDALVQHDVGASEIPASNVSFDTLNGLGSVPPDPVGAVGPNHYVVMANVRYAVYSKTGTLLAGPANINTLWSGFGGACQNENAGDPIVLYDRQADRWLLTQFTPPAPPTSTALRSPRPETRPVRITAGRLARARTSPIIPSTAPGRTPTTSARASSPGRHS